MNDLDQWEKALRSWTPRRPSADIKAKLFSPAEFVTPPLWPQRKLSWLWYGPAAAAILLLAAFLSNGSAPQVFGLLACVTSNQPASSARFDLPSLPAGCCGQQNNVWAVATFDWTKATSCVSTIGSFRTWKTNTQKL